MPASSIGSGQSVVRMKNLVSALGLDPARTTLEEISDSWLRCSVCSPMSKELFSWEAALRDPGNTPGQDKMTVRWGCTLCPDWDSTGPEVESHLRDEHQMEDWDKCIEDGDLYLHYNQPFNPTHSLVLPGPEGPGSDNIV